MLNAIDLMGRMTTDPEIRQTPTGVRVVNFTLASQRNVKDSTGNRKTDFIPCVAWQGCAEFISRNFHKGDLVIVSGMMQSRSFTDRNDNKRNVVELVVSDVYFSGERRDGGNAAPYNDNSAPAHGGHDEFAQQQGFTEVEDNQLPF